MNTSDFERTLGGWLQEGPVAAPDRPVDLAIEHARAHPRGLDPLRFVRPDPMPPFERRSGLRPAWLLAAAALLIVALAAVAIGSRLNQSIVPLPGPTPTRSASPSASPSAPSTPTARALPTVIADELGGRHDVTVVDRSGLLVDAASGQPRAGDDFSGRIGLSQDGSSAIRVGWVTCPTDAPSRLTIDETGRRFALEQGECRGDTLGVGVVLVLTFSRPVEADAIETTWSYGTATPSPTEATP